MKTNLIQEYDAVNSRVRFYVKLYLLLCLVAGLLLFAGYNIGFRLNRSPSTPRGLWLLQPNMPVGVGNFVAVPPGANPGYALALERGYFREGAIMLKIIIAAEGDLVDYDHEEKAVTVNGRHIPATEIFPYDSQGRPLYPASFPVVLGSNQVWLSSEWERGFDSRYFGPVYSETLTKAVPVWVFR